MTSTAMQAIHVDAPKSFALTTLPVPSITEPYDLLVRVRAVALNPVDTKILKSAAVGRIMGYDAAGTVDAVGPQAEALGFKTGDDVIYAGSLGRAGSNAQFQLVDARIVAKKPQKLAWDEAAALPLVGLTAWEMFEDKFRLKPFSDNSQEVLVVVNGAGGVGTMALTLAKNVRPIFSCAVQCSNFATGLWYQEDNRDGVASRNDRLGEEVRRDRRYQPSRTSRFDPHFSSILCVSRALGMCTGPQIQALGVTPTLAFITYDTPHYIKELIPLMRYLGQIGSIVETDNEEPVPVHSMDAFTRSLSFHWEFMAGKPMHGCVSLALHSTHGLTGEDTI